MKKAKSVIAAMLAVIMTVCMIPFASALEVGDTITWTYDNTDGMEYAYAGNLFASNEITDYGVYTYSPRSSGYYLIESEYDSFFVAETFDITEGKAHELRDCIESTDREKIYYFDESEDIAIAAFCYGTLEIEYYGAGISEIIMANDMLDNLIINCDIPANSAEFSLYADATVVFDSGKSVKTEVIDFETADGSNIKEGENEVNAVVLGEKFAFTMTACRAAEIVKSMSLTNSDNYAYIYEDYKGFYNGKDIVDEKIEVTFANGEILSCPYSGGFRRADFCNDRSYEVFARYNDYAKTLEIGFASEVNATGWSNNCYVVTSYDCKIVTGDIDHNLAMLEEYNQLWVDVAGLNYNGFGSNPEILIEAIVAIFRNTFDCITYCTKSLVNIYF
ncbi:MAG: hypothetical protein IJD78_00240 [Clostridia bacterium]|nr:hypothetical protein [Clostridia bacterium]